MFAHVNGVVWEVDIDVDGVPGGVCGFLSGGVCVEVLVFYVCCESLIRDVWSVMSSGVVLSLRVVRSMKGESSRFS